MQFKILAAKMQRLKKQKTSVFAPIILKRWFEITRKRFVYAEKARGKGQNGRGSNPALDSLVAVRISSPGRPEPCKGNLVAAAKTRACFSL